MRCKACNAILLPAEIIWDEGRLTHEELCRKCRYASDEPVLYDEDMIDDGVEETPLEE